MSQVTTLRYDWDTIHWPTLERNVFKLQKRIYQASQQGDQLAVRKLQRLLLCSASAKWLAVRRVTQDNRGKKTAGVDGQTVLTKKERHELVADLPITAKAMPVRRIWIPKPGKAEKRPLGIPTIRDRVNQALVKMGLEPEWEAKFEPNSYGFRPGRSAQDAIAAIFGAINGKQAYVLDADIAGCFDNIDQTALLSKLKCSPFLRRRIKSWLKAGVLDGAVFKPTQQGTPQGGIISPLLANIALHGLEMDTKKALSRDLQQYMKQKCGKGSYMLSARMLSIIRYADDFVVIHEDQTLLLKAKEYIATWLHQMGLCLKDTKTRLCHTYQPIGEQPAGFNFLGFHVRQYRSTTRQRYATLIKPSKEALQRHLIAIRQLLRSHRGESQDTVIRNLNPLIKGWSNYYKTVVARKIFEKADHLMFQKLWRWARYRHPQKGRRWVKDRYFLRHRNNHWRFKTIDHKLLAMHSDYRIKYFVKVKDRRSPYDGDHIYWSARMGRYPTLSPRVAEFLKKQQGRCKSCGLYFRPLDILEVHHADGHHGNNQPSNLVLLHGHCHDRVHQRSMNDKHLISEEPDVLKGASPVLEPSMGGDAHA